MEYYPIPDAEEDRSKLIIRAVRKRQEISSGTYGTVYVGRYKGRQVAVKEMKDGKTTEEAFWEEVTIMNASRHPNIIEFIGAMKKPHLRIIMEFMTGGTLRDFLNNMHPRVPKTSIGVSFGIQISKGMQYLHNNKIIHRDLKPTNLLLSGDMKTIKIADFGLARQVETTMTAHRGTVKWMAPEVLLSEQEKKDVQLINGLPQKSYDHKVDVFSFGVIFFEILTNKDPYQGMKKAEIIHKVLTSANCGVSTEGLNVNPLLGSIITMCCCKDPSKRPEFSEILEFLEEFQVAQNCCCCV